jgi:chromosome segregation ATPase
LRSRPSGDFAQDRRPVRPQQTDQETKAELESQIEALNAQLQQKGRDIEELEAANSELEREKGDLEAQISKLRREAQLHEGEQARLRAKIERASDAELTKLREAFQNQLDLKDQTISRLRTEGAQAKLRIDQLESELEKPKPSTATDLARIHRLESQLRFCSRRRSAISEPRVRA